MSTLKSQGLQSRSIKAWTPQRSFELTEKGIDLINRHCVFNSLAQFGFDRADSLPPDKRVTILSELNDKEIQLLLAANPNEEVFLLHSFGGFLSSAYLMRNIIFERGLTVFSDLMVSAANVLADVVTWLPSCTCVTHMVYQDDHPDVPSTVNHILNLQAGGNTFSALLLAYSLRWYNFSGQDVFLRADVHTQLHLEALSIVTE